MLTIRLIRIGKTKQPSYRLVVMEKSKDIWANYLENLGHYNPRSKEGEFAKDRIEYWVSKGAQLSKTANNLLVGKKVIEGKKSAVTHLSKKRRAKIEKEQAKA
ncbi:MAG TPA: 30S ribosomal protein S16 [bacterium]|nr:30S ribosomal protein S16 [bacterium]